MNRITPMKFFRFGHLLMATSVKLKIEQTEKSLVNTEKNTQK